MTDPHEKYVGALTTPKMGLKTVGRRPNSDINMDGSIGEAFISLDLDLTKENVCNYMSESDLMG